MTVPENHPKIPEPVPPLPLPEFDYEDLDKQERIGTGGDANVYRATLKHDGYTYAVAIKEPRFEGTIQKRTIEKFQNEAETWAGLNDHDNIVSVYDWGSQPVPWLALEHMDGGTLETRIGDADLEEALWLAGRIAEGIRYGHRHGIAHLDIKPTNILLRETGPDTWSYPKVSDWGLAKLLLEHSNSVEGISPTYAAPEQFDAEKFGSPDDITDIYQLGTVAYALVTGEPPFSGSSTAVMRSILDDEPRPPSEVNSEVPGEVNEIVLKALAKRKGDRYEGILPFRNALDELFAEVADTKITSRTTDQASTGRPGSITPAASWGDSDSGTGNERSKSAQAESGGESTDQSATGDRTSLSRRRLLGLLGVGIVGTGGVLISRSIGSDDDSAGVATMPTAVPTTPQPETATPTSQSTTTQPEETPTETETTTTKTTQTETSAKSETSFQSFTTTVRATSVFLNQEDYGSYAATKPDPISLRQHNIKPGEQITIVVTGGYVNHPSGETKCQLIGVFSESSTLLDNTQHHRIPGAIDAGRDYVTHKSEDFNTDIPEDFFLSGDRQNTGDCNVRTTTVQVPLGASYLFIGVEDQNLRDNTGQVSIEIQPVE